MEQVALGKAVISPQCRRFHKQTPQGFPQSWGEREQVSFTTTWSSHTGFAMSSFKVTEIARMTGLNHLLESSVMAAYLMLLACGLMYLNHRVLNFQATEKVHEKSLHYSNIARGVILSQENRKNFINFSNNWRYRLALCRTTWHVFIRYSMDSSSLPAR